jgi:hypothetical protein
MAMEVPAVDRTIEWTDDRFVAAASPGSHGPDRDRGVRALAHDEGEVVGACTPPFELAEEPLQHRIVIADRHDSPWTLQEAGPIRRAETLRHLTGALQKVR